MYGNLRNELNKKNISQKAVAELIECTEKTISNKISGDTDFTIAEAISIRKNLLPEFNMDYLFSRTA